MGIKIFVVMSLECISTHKWLKTIGLVSWKMSEWWSKECSLLLNRIWLLIKLQMIVENNNYYLLKKKGSIF